MHAWTVVPLERGLREHSATWDRLRRHQFRDNPFLDSLFVDALLHHFADGSERLCILGPLHEPRAMCILRPRNRLVWESFLPPQAQIGPSLLKDPAAALQLLRALPFPAGELHVLCNDPDFGDLSDADNRKRETRDHALTMNIDLSGSFEDYWDSRPRKLVQNMRRYERRLAGAGMAARFVHIDAPDDLQAAVGRYGDLESAGWKGRNGTAIGACNAQGHFYLDVMRRFAGMQGAEVHELWLGETLAASRLTVASGATLVMLKTTYDESLSPYAPGRLLLRQVIRHHFQRKVRQHIEFYTDANTDLLAWSTGKRWIRHVRFNRNLATYRALELARIAQNILRTRGASTPAADAADTSPEISCYRPVADVPSDVRQLFDQAESTSIEFGLDWYGNLVDTVFAPDGDCRLYVLRRGGVPIAAMPVHITTGRFGTRILALANYYSALFGPALAPIAKASDLAALLRFMMRDNEPVVCFRFAPMDPASVGYRRLFNGMRLAGLAAFQFFCFGNWHQTVTGDWKTYLAARDGALRNTARRMGNRFAKAGGRLELVQGGAGLDAAIDAYDRVYATSWKNPEPHPGFVPGLMRLCAQRGWLRLGLAWIGDQPIAAQLWIVANGKASIYKLAFDDRHKALAPGTLVTALLMHHVIDIDKVAEIDYLIGDDPYKKSWVDARRERWGLIGYNPRSIIGLAGILGELASRMVRRIKTR